jgi:hypothetical protein
MPSLLADALVKRATSIGDPKTRVGLFRTLIPTLAPDELQAAMDEIVARAGLRDSGAQIALLSLAEALADLRANDASESDDDTADHGDDEKRGTDWGTGRPLSLGERKSLARRPDRKLLDRALRDAHPDVITELLVNPRLTEGDVARMCASPRARAAVLIRVFASPRWALRPRVRRAIAGNPKTPVEIAIALVPLLGRAELQEIAGDGRIRNPVRARALEILRRLPPTPAGPSDVQ